ncbi:hypothetical protein BY458DRAFT_352805 [Sporodiniella umbellata]|nr:hypothetical protein BY458DRAFT_352805 [Sporodiniella umbellata]
MDKEIRVQFQGGREMIGTLKGYDPLLNLVLDNTTENKKDLEGESNTDNKRTLGLSVLRGTSIILISPLDGMEQIENPFGH